jgi:ectoine hydroxylase-related dioxygenase (phytanoyl-CoA dioxygenase family)
VELPEPTNDLDQAADDLGRTGLAIVPDAVDATLTAEALKQLNQIADDERRLGRALLEDGSATDGRYTPGPNQRVLSLLEKDAVFADLACHEVPLALTRRVFGKSYGYPHDVVDRFSLADLRLSSATANIANSGGVPMELHADQGFAPATDYPILVNALWPLVDIDAGNGATEVVPGSHHAAAATMIAAPPTPTPISATAGSVILFDGRTWHRTGANNIDTSRPVVLINYCRPWVRPFDDDIRTFSENLLRTEPWFVYDHPALTATRRPPQGQVRDR